jgi:hypothetical protein
MSLGKYRTWRSPIFQGAPLSFKPRDQHWSCVDTRRHGNVQKSTVDSNIYSSTSEQLQYSKKYILFPKAVPGRTVSPSGPKRPTGRMPFMHGPRECNGFKTSHNGNTLVWRRCHRTPLPFLNFICACVRNTSIGVFLNSVMSHTG